MLRRLNKDRGFLLLEVLISIVIISTTLIVINRAFSTSLRAVRLAADYLLANCVLEDKMFDIQIKESFSDIRVSDTIELGQEEFFYLMAVAPPDISGGEDIDTTEELPLKEARLSINWGDADNVSGLNLTTYVWEEQEE